MREVHIDAGQRVAQNEVPCFGQGISFIVDDQHFEAEACFKQYPGGIAGELHMLQHFFYGDAAGAAVCHYLEYAQVAQGFGSLEGNRRKGQPQSLFLGL